MCRLLALRGLGKEQEVLGTIAFRVCLLHRRTRAARAAVVMKGFSAGLRHATNGSSPAKAEVSSIFEKVGFATIDLGALATGGRLQQFPGGVLPTLNLIKLG